MSGDTVKRRYDSPARAQAALETRRRIRAAAAELFVASGYAATSMKAIAAARMRRRVSSAAFARAGES